MAPIMVRLQDLNIKYNYIFTGQHKETIDDIIDNFGVKQPDVILYDGKDITSIFQMFKWSVKLLFKSIFFKKSIFMGDKSGIVLVHGDTVSTLIGAIMGKLAGLKVGHVESGLRSFNYFHPFPEEITRILTFNLTDYYFCPGDWAVNNLKRFRGNKVNTELNTLYDSLNCALPSIEKTNVEIPDYEYGIVTLHRYENFNSMKVVNKIVKFVLKAADKHKLLFILHLPTKIQLEKFGKLKDLENHPNIEFRDRYDYFRFIKLIISSKFIISDGGSNQEECYYLGKPIILLRNATERNEGLGKNAVLSKFDENIFEDFINNTDNYKHLPVKLENTPTDIIVENIKNFS